MKTLINMKKSNSMTLKNEAKNPVRKMPFIMMLATLFMIVSLSAFAVQAAETNKSESTETAVTEATASDVQDTAEEISEESTADSATGSKAMAAAIAIGLAAGCGAIGMGLSIAKSVEGISRQPEAEGKIRTSLMLGLVFVETAIIYALIIAILIIFVL